MRKNTARHWLHAGLDLLPLILIPVFMIYSHRHDLSTDITIQQDVYKDFYQGVKNGKPNSINNWYYNDEDSPNNTLIFHSNRIEYSNQNGEDGALQCEVDITSSLNDIVYFKFDYYLETQDSLTEFYLINSDFSNSVGLGSDSLIIEDVSSYTSLYTLDNTITSYYIQFYFYSDCYIELSNVQIFNLTQIFGSGNEPTKEVFESYLTQDYYDFGSNQVKVGTIDVPAKNNDIMSVFMDSFNNSIDKYFNMGNVFGMTNVYNWFNTNIFGGTTPVVIYSVWNIVLYEFVMDLLFLLYALFMWFIDVTKRLIEKPLDSIK